MNRSYVVTPLLFLTWCLPSAALAQQSQPAPSSPQTTSPALPSDPAALLQLASQVNGLHGADLQPWHVHATWQTLDDEGQPKEQGTWDEWWAGEKKYKTVYKSADVDWTTYGTEKGRYVAGGPDKAPWQFATVERLVQYPVAMVKSTPTMKNVLSMTHVQRGPAQLICALQDMVAPDGSSIDVRRLDGTMRQLEASDCFAPDLPAVRAEEISQGSQTVFNFIVRFQGRYLAKNIRYVSGSETDITVETIEPLDPVIDADFTPPADAVLVPETKTITVGAGLMAGNRTGGSAPKYPPDALAARVQGTVVLRARILRDGTIGDLSVISGPAILQQSAFDAVKTWRYRPYVLNGQPVEVETQINVVYQIGH